MYPLGVEIKVEGGYFYQIASPEKALCDKLYSLLPVYSVKALKELLFDDLRIDEAAFFALQKDDISQLAPLYRATNLKLLAKFMEGKQAELVECGIFYGYYEKFAGVDLEEVLCG